MDAKNIVKHYKNEDITVVWNSGLCTHSGVCFRGLPEVFDPRIKPWIRLENADTEIIKNQVSRCPSKALTYFENES